LNNIIFDTGDVFDDSILLYYDDEREINQQKYIP